MKKIIILIFVFLFISNTLLLASCQTPTPDDTPGEGEEVIIPDDLPDGTENENLSDSPSVVLKEDLTNTVFFGDYLIDDATPVSELKNEYSLNDLKEFFKNKKNEQLGGIGELAPALFLSEVDNRFPIEIIRSNGYVVYKVKEGGYFYIFWIHSVDPDIEPSVYFTTYLSEELPLSKFSVLTVGSSTAKDVKAVDPEFYLSFVKSSGTYSYSYLNDTAILEIKYKNIASPLTYDALLITKITVISRGDLEGGLYGMILSKDLPE